MPAFIGRHDQASSHVAGFGAYAIAMALLSKVVLSIPLGLTYALWSGIGTIAIVLVGRFAYSQLLSPAQLFGIGLITAGVVLVNLGK